MSSSQAGLVRCYLRALAADSLSQLAPLTITHSDAPATLTEADLVHAADAHHGTTKAAFILNDSDPFDATVVLTYSDGKREHLGMDALNVMEPASKSWRLDLGRFPPSTAPPPATR